MGSHASQNARDATAVMVALRRIVRLLRLADRDAESAHGLSAAQLFVLHTLSKEPALSLSDLAQRTMTDQSSVSSVVTKLAERRFVTRSSAKSDRRRTELRLTPSGERVVRAAPRVPQSMIGDVIAKMSSSARADLVRSLEGFASAIGANEVAPRMLFEDEPNGRRRRSRNDTAK